MRPYFLLFFFTAILFNAQAQIEEDTLIHTMPDSTTSFFYIFIPPTFPGGDEAFSRFLASNVIYPEDARMQKIQGVVYVEFIVEKDGSLSNINVAEGKGLSPSCDQEVIRALSSSPKWKTGMKDGVLIRTKIVKGIKFALVKGPEKKK